MRSEKVDRAIIKLREFRQIVRCASYAEIILSIDAVIDYIELLEQLVGDVDEIDTQFIHKDKVFEIVDEINQQIDVYNVAVDKFNKLLKG